MSFLEVMFVALWGLGTLLSLLMQPMLALWNRANHPPYEKLCSSYAETVGRSNYSNQGPMQLRFHKPILKSSRRVVALPPNLVVDGAREWQFCLVGYFVDKHLPLSSLNTIARKLCGVRGLVDVLGTEQGFFFFKISSTKSCLDVLESSQWHFSGKTLVLKHWTPRIIMSKEARSKVPV
ncbi:hypothetical protein CerSpe_114240 [Prunus speciosa]